MDRDSSHPIDLTVEAGTGNRPSPTPRSPCRRWIAPCWRREVAASAATAEVEHPADRRCGDARSQPPISRRRIRPTNVLSFPRGRAAAECPAHRAPGRSRAGVRDRRPRGGRREQAVRPALAHLRRARHAAPAGLRSRGRRRGPAHGAREIQILAGLGIPDPYRGELAHETADSPRAGTCRLLESLVRRVRALAAPREPERGRPARGLVRADRRGQAEASQPPQRRGARAASATP